MRFRSIMAILVIAIASLGFVGCGSSSDSFVATGNPDGPPSTGGLTFNFITAQSPFTVDAATNTLRFDFFDGTSANAVLSVTRPFAASVTIENIPASVRAVLITGFDANGFPLFTINQTVTVTAGSTTTVDGLTNAVPVTLTQLRLAPGTLFDLDSELTQVSVQVGGTTQVFLFAEFSNGSIVLLGDQATYSIPADGSGIASVSNLGTVTGLSSGTTTLLAQFGGQTLSRPVVSSDGFNPQLESINVINPTPITVASSAPVQITTNGNRVGGGSGIINPSSLGYTTDNVGFTVSANGLLSVSDQVTSGTTANLTVTWTNPDNTPVSTVVAVQAQ